MIEKGKSQVKYDGVHIYVYVCDCIYDGISPKRRQCYRCMGKFEDEEWWRSLDNEEKENMPNHIFLTKRCIVLFKEELL